MFQAIIEIGTCISVQPLSLRFDSDTLAHSMS